jgi:hypothetical protein
VKRRIAAPALVCALALAACGSTVNDDTNPTYVGGGPVWTSTSASIRLDFQVWPNGTTAWEKARAELTPDQLSILASLTSGPPVHSKKKDVQEVLVHVTEADSSRHDFRVVFRNDFAASAFEDLPVVDYRAFKPFLDGVQCLLSLATDDQADHAGFDEVTGDPRAPWTVAPDVTDDSGCINPIHKQKSGAPTWVRVHLSSAATYQFGIEPCSESAQLHLRSSDASTELAASSPVVSPACASLTYTTAAPGPFLLSIEGGSFDLRIRRP